MKLAITGKGGVGKTMVAGTLARLFGRKGMKILAVDADPTFSLWSTLGISADVAGSITPLLEDDELVNKRTDAKWVEVLGNFFRMNPRVDDLVEKFAVPAPDNVSLLVAGTVRMGGQGCMCPSATLLKALITHLSLDRQEAFVMDMDAGIENLGRGTTRGMDALIAVIEPGLRAISVLDRIRDLAEDIGQENILVVANKINGHRDEELVREEVAERGLTLLGIVPLDESVREADRRGISPIDLDASSPAMAAMERISFRIHECLAQRHDETSR